MSVQITRLALWLLGVFALAALALAAVGIYGVMSYSVKQRTREIGMRLALGATSRDILWLVMRDVSRVSGLCAAIGVSAGVVAARSLSALLYGTSPADPLTLGGAAFVLVAVALLACYIPARRATRIAPRSWPAIVDPDRFPESHRDPIIPDPLPLPIRHRQPEGPPFVRANVDRGASRCRPGLQTRSMAYRARSTSADPKDGIQVQDAG